MGTRVRGAKLTLSAGMAVALAIGMLAAGPTAYAATAPGLGTAGSFAVLAGSTVTNTGPTTITGDVGLAPGSALTGFGSVTLHGAQHVADAVATQAKLDLTNAYTLAANATPATIVATELGGTTLTAGVYKTAAGTLGLTGKLTLDAAGDPNAVFIFEADSTLITAPASTVALINGASPCNVFWRVGSSATLDTTTSFVGNILAADSIAMKTGATLQGRALAQTGAVTLDTNTITNAACSAAATASPSVTPSASPSATPSTAPSATPAPTATTAATVPPTSTADQIAAQPGTSPLVLVALMFLVALSLMAASRRYRDRPDMR